MTTRDELIRRSGKDPVVLDRRSSEEILNDEIPYMRWSKEAAVIVRTGCKTWADLLRERYVEKVERARSTTCTTKF